MLWNCRSAEQKVHAGSTRSTPWELFTLWGGDTRKHSLGVPCRRDGGLAPPLFEGRSGGGDSDWKQVFSSGRNRFCTRPGTMGMQGYGALDPGWKPL